MQYRATAGSGAGGPRVPPDWARQLLDTVSRQCAARQRDSIALFRSFDSDGDGFISHSEFQAAMLKLGGYNKESVSAEAQVERRVTSSTRAAPCATRSC